METSPKVCMLIARFYPHLGGTELQALRLSQCLKNKGINVFVVTQRFQDLKKIEEIGGVKIYRLFNFGKGKFSSLLFMLSSTIFLVRKNKEYDLIHVHLASSPAIVAIIIKKFFNKKVIVKLAGGKDIGDVDSSLKTIVGRLKLSILKNNVDNFIAVSGEIKQQLIENKFPFNKIVEIPNGVDVVKFSPLNELEKSPARKFLKLPSGYIFAFVGRIAKEKNLNIFLDAFNKAISACPQIYLLIIGEGPELADLKKKVQDLKKEQNILFLGKVENVEDYLKAADVFVLPSVSEGLPNSLLEAMASGLTILASKVGGIKEVVGNGVEGILFEPDKTEQITAAVLKVVNNRQWASQLGIRARQSVVRNYSMNIILDKYIQLYCRLFKE